MTECPWKGALSELNRHLKVCPFDEKRISDYVKKQFTKKISDDVKKSYYDDDTNTGEYLGYNPKNASLKARLFQKNPELMGKVLNDEEKGNDNLDLFELIGVESRNMPQNNLNETEYNKISDSTKNHKNSYNNIDYSDRLHKCDDNFIFPIDYEKNIKTKTENLLNNKRQRDISKKMDENEDINFINEINSSESIDENEKNELEYVLELSLREIANNRGSILEDN
jgi:hypothetical protein